MESWFTTYKIPIGASMKVLIDGLLAYSRVFDSITGSEPWQ